VNLGVRATLADMGQTIAENFGGKILHGTSFLAELAGQRTSEAAR
jgi:phosphopentomutase